MLSVLLGAFLLYLSVPNLGPALRAARADGVPGVFTAQRLYCVQHPGHESCTWTGEFRSHDGEIHRTGISLYGSDRHSTGPGRPTKAFDTGRSGRVYGVEGSREWIFVTVLFLSGAAVLAFPFARTLSRLGRSRTPMEKPPGSPG